MAEPNREPSLSILRWLIEAGGDEAIVEEPVNRFRTPSPPARESLNPERVRAPARGVMMMRR